MNIAVLGLGVIGRALVGRLMADGHQVRGWNRTPKPDFPGFASTLPGAIAGAEIIFLVVADPPAVQSVLDGILPHLRHEQLLVQSSTVSARWTLEFARQVEATGARFLEAPFTGSGLAVQTRQTVYHLGGEPELVARARPVLEPVSRAILHVGPVGTASTLKLAMSVNAAGVAQALIESLALCRAAGVSDDLYFEALARDEGHSTLADLKRPQLHAADYRAQFPLKHLSRDLRLALETAVEHYISLGQTECLKVAYDMGAKAGWKEDDFIGLIRLMDKP